MPSADTHQLKPAFQPEKDVLETVMFHRMLEGGSRCIIIILPILKKENFNYQNDNDTKIRENTIYFIFCISLSYFFLQNAYAILDISFSELKMTSHHPGNHGSQPLGEMISKLIVEHESFTYRKYCIHIQMLIKGKEEHLYGFWSICLCEK